MNITRYAIILACGFLLQGCKILAASDIPTKYPVSVTRVQLNPEEPGWHRLEIVFSGEHGFDGSVENIPYIGGVAAICSDKDRELRDAMVVKTYFRDLVGEENKSSVLPEPDGSYLYSALISVSAEGIKEGRGVKGGGGGLPDGISYDLADVPQGLCSRRWDAQIVLFGFRTWAAIPKEMIDRALALPPDPERSAAWRRERAYGSRPSLSGPP